MVRISDDISIEETLRRALLAVEDLRGALLVQSARAEALTEELRPRLAKLSAAERDRVTAELDARAATYLEAIRESDAVSERRLQIGPPIDKYAVTSPEGLPCDELIPLCHGRCCSFDFPLSSQDLDEGVIAWDRGRPYLIQHGPDGYCVHCDPTTRACGTYQHRPAPCRTYDCRDDPRVWIDFEQRISAPLGVEDPPEWSSTFNLLDRLGNRDRGLAAEAEALDRARKARPR